MTTVRTFTTATAALLLALCGSGLASGSDPQPPEIQPLPPELQEGLPPGSPPQGSADLARTRDELYARELTASQHDEILSWRTHDLEWWLDDARRATAKAKLAHLDQLFHSLDDQGDFPDAVWNSADLFGVDVKLEWEFSGAGEEGGAASPVLRQAIVSYDARKRPDLFDFYELVHGFANAVASSASGEGRFLQVIEPAAETMQGVAAYQMTVAFIEGLKQEIGALASLSLRAAMTRYVERGEAYTASAADVFKDSLSSEIESLTEKRTQDYLDALQDDFKKRLSAHVIREAQSGLRVSRGYFSRHLKETQATDFEALLSEMRGGKDE